MRTTQRTDRPRLRRLDLCSEALAAVLQRPGRSTATIVGIMLGVGSLVAIVGLAQTVSGQIGSQFSTLEVTQVTVRDLAPPTGAASSFPDDAEERLERLNGVAAAGWHYRIQSEAQHAVSTAAVQQSGTIANADLYGVTSGFGRAAQPEMVDGVWFDPFHDHRAERVAIVSRIVADQLLLPPVSQRPAIFLEGTPFTVLGVISTPQRTPQLGISVVVPLQTALDVFEPPTASDPPEMLIRTEVGAAGLVAGQAPLALRPDNPDALSVIPPPDASLFQAGVQGTVDNLLLGLASIALIAGAMSISNTMTVSTLERTGEIGLRRSLGARPWHIGAQFLLEAALLGFIGGVLGTAAGVVTVVGTAVVRGWTAVLAPWLVALMPIAGAMVGVIAGCVPSLRAARTEPATALRH